VNRIAIVCAVCLALTAVFAAVAVSVVHDRRPLDAKLTRSFATAVSSASTSNASVSAPECWKVSVEFFGCTASVTPPRRATSVPVYYNVWLDDDGCWDTQRRTKGPQSPALGRLRARLYRLRGCIAR
jgi:hypothetical protein